MDRHKTIFLLGVPRSGTTWIARILSQAKDTESIIEPDNEKTSLLARCYKNQERRFPVIGRGDTRVRFAQLWKYAFYGRRADLFSRSFLTRALLFSGNGNERYVHSKEEMIRGGSSGKRAPYFLEFLVGMRSIGKGTESSNKTRIVKSVHAALCCEWINDLIQPTKTLLVLRHPFSVVDSWRRLGMPDGVRLYGLAASWLEEFGTSFDLSNKNFDSQFERMCVQLAYMYKALDEAKKRNPKWVLIKHEDLCADTVGGFRRLFRLCGLDWHRGVARELEKRNREGNGFETFRVAKAEIGKWKKGLTAEEVSLGRKIFDAYGLKEYLDD
jgi:hypothetical protein